MLTDKVKDRLIELITQKAEELNIGILALEVMPDYVHLFVNVTPDISIQQAVFRIKGYTARVLRCEFLQLKKMPSMWTRSYFASTAGNVSNKTIQKYIEAQSKK